uniref:CCHC-type domain-containing protein n=1 Tax=Panagrolaimus superbus TaxID=310955 RepID=A0A914Y7Q8_9BILA
MADYFFDDLIDIKEDIIIIQQEYDGMIQQFPPPWTEFQKADFHVLRTALMRNRDKWDEEFNLIKVKIDRLQNNDPAKNLTRQRLRTFKRNDENKRIQREMSMQIDRIERYLLLEQRFEQPYTDQMSSRSSIAFSEEETQLDDESVSNAVVLPQAPIVVNNYSTSPGKHTLASVSSSLIEKPIVLTSDIPIPSRPSTFHQIQVPSLNIPKFTGEYLKWNAFWQTFEIAVHQQNYPQVSKLIALRSYLGGRALEEVESFTISGENYETMVNTLKSRFGNPQFIIREFDLKLNALRPAQSNAESIRLIVVSVTNICREMKNFGINTDNYSLKNQIVSKLPPKEKCTLELMLFKNPETSIDIILEKMKEMEIEAEFFSSSKSRQQMPSSTRPLIDESVQAPVWQPTSSTNQQHQRPCSFCDGSHRSFKCMKYKTTEERINCLKAKKCCINCAAADHLQSECPKTSLKLTMCSKIFYFRQSR